MAATPVRSIAAERPQPKEPMFAQLTSLPRSFWMVNIMEMFERLAYYGVRTVIPIYIAQADEPGGLHFTQIQKGEIFFVWAVVQSLVPMIPTRGPATTSGSPSQNITPGGARS